MLFRFCCSSGGQAATAEASLHQLIVVNGAARGRIFEGIGAVSAGASSRLLIEYPERQRREVLDYLFKPGFGAGFQHLKVEIGGEVNSTDGIEPTHMRMRGEENYQRGYEWWLMKEAKKRNDAITLDCLAWGAPGWIGGGKFYSPDMADYVAKFLVGAKRVHGLDIAYTGIWNETLHEVAWIKLLRHTLDQAGLDRVGIVAADETMKGGWKIVDEMEQDAELRAAVARVGVHYRKSNSPAKAQAIGCPLWSSEDGPWRGDWPGTSNLVRIINRNYVTGKYTKTEIWSPVTAYYDSLPLPGSGVMRANEPWSGFYEVQPAVWAVAHTTQFAKPGWRYLDSACVMIQGGSVVALQSPKGRDYSLVIETMDALSPQTVEFQIAGLPDKKLHVWRTSEKVQFEQVADLRPLAGHFSMALDPTCIYSLTTTSGQRKGEANPPASRLLALPYQDDFSSYKNGATPRCFSDQSGAFEVSRRADGRGKVLRQVSPGSGIEWSGHKNPEPETVMGDLLWKDYSVAADVCIGTNSYVALLGRISHVPQNDHMPSCYRFKVAADGHWELRAISNLPGDKPKSFHTTGEDGPPLAQGQVNLAAGQWHHLKLGMNGDQITVRIDRSTLATLRDPTHSHGQAGLGCGWGGDQFASFSIRANGDLTSE